MGDFDGQAGLSHAAGSSQGNDFSWMFSEGRYQRIELMGASHNRGRGAWQRGGPWAGHDASADRRVRPSLRVRQLDQALALISRQVERARQQTDRFQMRARPLTAFEIADGANADPGRVGKRFLAQSGANPERMQQCTK
jgi:hypothetical protein